MCLRLMSLLRFTTDTMMTASVTHLLTNCIFVQINAGKHINFEVKYHMTQLNPHPKNERPDRETWTDRERDEAYMRKHRAELDAE